MPDREKVIKGLECHENSICEDGKRHLCPYWQDTHCSQKLSADVIALLKEQQKLIDEITQRRMNDGAFD